MGDHCQLKNKDKALKACSNCLSNLNFLNHTVKATCHSEVDQNPSCAQQQPKEENPNLQTLNQPSKNKVFKLSLLEDHQHKSKNKDLPFRVASTMICI